jgi:hypothetical protein
VDTRTKRSKHRKARPEGKGSPKKRFIVSTINTGIGPGPSEIESPPPLSHALLCHRSRPPIPFWCHLLLVTQYGGTPRSLIAEAQHLQYSYDPAGFLKAFLQRLIERQMPQRKRERHEVWRQLPVACLILNTSRLYRPQYYDGLSVWMIIALGHEIARR